MNINNQFNIIPFEPLQQAVALSIAEIESKLSRNKKVSDYPYATAFFIRYFGSRIPKKSDLNLIQQGDISVKEKTVIIDDFIKSNGTLHNSIDITFAVASFPSLKNKTDWRSELSSDMKVNQYSKVNSKRKDKRELEREAVTAKLLESNCTGLGEWVSDTQSTLLDFEQVKALELWFNLHRSNSDWGFNDLYSGMNASQIAYDLSFGEED